MRFQRIGDGRIAQAVADAGDVEDGQGSAISFGQDFGLFQGL
jgi:hypothetical protein